MGANEELKREAVGDLERGGLLAFGISEKAHGADLLANEFELTQTAPGRFVANGSKYYIGNANAAAIITILAKRNKAGERDRHRRTPIVLCVVRPPDCKSIRHMKKIRTLGVRAGYVGGFEEKDHHLPETDVVAEGRQAWDAVFGTVTLGKFFLGFGAIGICEHALEEGHDHLKSRYLYGHPAIGMALLRPHHDGGVRAADGDEVVCVSGAGLCAGGRTHRTAAICCIVPFKKQGSARKA